MKRLIAVALTTVAMAFATERCARDTVRTDDRSGQLSVIDGSAGSRLQMNAQPVPAAPPSHPSTAAAVAPETELGWMGTDSENEPSALSAQLQREARDGVWAPYGEQTIRTQISRVSSLGERENLRIACGSTVCEVVGSFPRGSSEEAMATVTEAMQSTALRDGLLVANIMSGAQTFDTTNGTTTFRLYFMKAPG